MLKDVIPATRQYNIVYVYSIDDEPHRGLLKVGKATLKSACFNLDLLPPLCDALVKAAKARINEQTTTSAVPYKLEYVELAHFVDANGQERMFEDGAVHQVLTSSGFKRHKFPNLEKDPKEWFEVDLATVKQAIAAVKEGRHTLNDALIEPSGQEIIFREEQLAAIKQTTQFFKKKGKMLWNAKMRFGKTLCALEVVRQCGFFRTLILTHRPAVKSGWFDDMHHIHFVDYHYGSKPSADTKNGQPAVGETFENLCQTKKPFIYFASMQDLRGSWDKDSGEQKKNADIFATPWDLVIIDEAHEGTTTPLGKSVIRSLQGLCKRFLYLSGTPYNILDQFRPEEIYTWDYVQEQDAKNRWPSLHPDEPNPYEGLAHLNIRTYNLGNVFANYSHSEEDYFEFSEFFRTLTGDEETDGRPLQPSEHEGDFAHADDVRAFLDLLCKQSPDSFYPFSRDEYKDYFAHTFWVLPGVSAAKALSQMLQDHPFFKEFYVVNVAGDGDKLQKEESADDSAKKERLEKDCVKKVRNAISGHARTITLSCGRMTTGVSIEEWTAVFMLAGGYTTQAAGYLQTIFRAQTPFKRTPGIKAECYAFDFAPDRTLNVIDKFVKEQQRSQPDKSPTRITSERFLRHCSVIAIDGGCTVEYDAKGLMKQVNRVYADHIVRNGFSDSRLFVGVNSVGTNDLKWINEIVGNISKKSRDSKPSKDKIVVTDSGLDGDNAPKAQPEPQATTAQTPLQKKGKLTPEQEARTKLQKLLTIVAVRMPMMIYGTLKSVDSLNIASFVKSIDAASWEEFMPTGFKKDDFAKLLPFFDNDAFLASASAILQRSQDIEKLDVHHRVPAVADLISSFHYPDKETVLTPWRVVNMHMSETIGGYDFFDADHTTPLSAPRFVRQGGITQEVFEGPNPHLLEINSKSGVYPLWLAYTLFRIKGDHLLGGPPSSPAEERALWREVVEDNIFVVCKTLMAEKITRRVLAGYDDKIRPNTTTIVDLVDLLRSSDDLSPIVAQITNPKTYRNSNMTQKTETLKFNAVVGNPPYMLKQEETSDTPIYHLFMELSFKLSKLVTFISPGRFLFNAGKTPKEFNQRMLKDEHFHVVRYESASNKIFDNVDIKGGVAITLRNEDVVYGKIGIFTKYSELSSILSKVINRSDFESIDSLIYLQNKFNLNALYQDYPHYRYIIGSNGKEKRLTTGIFNKLDIFTNHNVNANDAMIIGLIDNIRVFKYIPQKYLEEHKTLHKWKVILPASNGSGAIGEVLSTPLIGEPLIGEPLIGYTQSFIAIGAFDKKQEAEATFKYVKSKFMRAMLGILKVTQHNHTDVWAYVPLQDFTSNSDIDWSQSIADIDRQLYSKYNLEPEETAFIEKMIKPME